MSPVASSVRLVPRRTRLLVLVLRGLGALITPAALVLYFFADRRGAWLPHSTAFVVVFVCAGLALLVWADVVTGQSAAEQAVYTRALGRLASFLRLRRRDGH